MIEQVPISGSPVDDEALQIAQFLTTFYDVYRRRDSDDPEAFFVSAGMVQDALEYQSLLVQNAALEEEILLYESYNQITSDVGRSSHSRINTRKDLKDRIRAFPGARQHLDVLALLERVQVWTAKALVQDLFISHLSEKGKPLCWSTLLNIPSAGYCNAGMPALQKTEGVEEKSLFGDMFERKFYANLIPGHTGSLCSLGVTPNIHTWPEFVKCAWMISLLPDKERGDLSHSQMAKILSKDLRETTSLKFQFSASDLVALWIRARRNTCSRRHLLQLFCISKHGKKYSAKFMGNHPHMTKRVWTESPLVDKLVAALVTNQVLCVNSAATKTLVSLDLAPDAKRLRQQHVTSSKRRKLNEDDRLTPAQRMQLIRACKIFVLRGWACRHSSALEPVLFDDTETQRKYTRGNILQNPDDRNDIGSYRFDGKCIDSVTCLSKIEDSLANGRIDPGDEFDDEVRAVLKTLKHAVKDKSTCAVSLEAATTQWDRFTKIFNSNLYSNGIAWISNSLFGATDIAAAEVDGILQEVLESAAPWPRACSKCKSNVLPTEEFKVCDCCSSVWHTKCIATCKTWNADTYLEAYKPLKEVYSVRVPSDSVPDFRGKDSSEAGVKWETKIIKADRRSGASGDGKLRPFGVQTITTHACMRDLNRLVHAGIKPTELDTLALPLAIDSVGFIVRDVIPGGCCESSGIKIGDVIVGMELVEFGSKREEDSKFKRKMYTFKSLSEQESRLLLRTVASVVKFIVKRANRPVLEEVESFMDRVRDMNASATWAIKASVAMWYCTNCANDQPRPAVQATENQVAREARFCSAVVRHLARQEFGTPFLFEHGEDQQQQSIAIRRSSGEKQDLGGCVSLCRLQLMMDSIESNESCSQQEPTVSHAFYDRSARLAWAPPGSELKPLELLCRGIGLLQPSAKESKDSTQAHRLLLGEFLRKVCSWCLAPGLASALRSKGPSRLACDYSWKLFQSTTTCHLCRVRFVEYPTIPCSSCGVTQEHVYPDVYEAAQLLQKHSSLVGSTLLLPPEDPLLLTVVETLRELHVAVDRYECPFEMLIAAYMPPNLDFPLTSIDSGGTFYLLPIANSDQVRFLLTQCRLLSLPSLGDYGWISTLLGIEGVIKMSPAEVERRTIQTKQILFMVESEVAFQAQCLCSNENADDNKSCSNGEEEGESEYDLPSHSFPCKTCAGRDDGSYHCLEEQQDTCTSNTVRLLDAFVHTRSNAFLAMLQVCGLQEDASDPGGDSAPIDNDGNARGDAKSKNVININDSDDSRAPVPVRYSRAEIYPRPVAFPRIEPQIGAAAVANPASRLVKVRALAGIAIESLAPVIKGKNTAGRDVSIQFKEYVRNLKPAILAARPRRQPFGVIHLHRHAATTHALSKAEVAMLFSATEHDLFMLGIRMLCPRYSLHFAVKQVTDLLSSLDFSTVPILGDDLWQAVISADFSRLCVENKNEAPAPNVFFDKGRHHYPFPSHSFGVDDVISTAFKRHLRSSLAAKSPLPQRIRGGGPTDSCDDATRSLVHLPLSSWNKQLVSGDCEAELAGSSQGISRCTGHVVFDYSKDNEQQTPEWVSVDIFHISNLGILGHGVRHVFCSANLLIAEPGSEAFTWERLFLRNSVKIVDPIGSQRPTMPLREGSIATRETVNETASPISHRDIGHTELLKKLAASQRSFLGGLSSGVAMYLLLSDPGKLYLTLDKIQDPESRSQSVRWTVVEDGKNVRTLFQRASEEFGTKLKRGDDYSQNYCFITISDNSVISEFEVEKLVQRCARNSWKGDSSNDPAFLVASLYCLFDVYNTGSYRESDSLTTETLKRRHHSSLGRPSAVDKHPQQWHGSQPCSVCALPNERVLLLSHKSYAGSGCKFTSHIREPKLSSTTHTLHGLSPLHTAKNMLIDLGNRIPEALKSSEPLSSFLWNGDNLDAWRQFVKCSCSLAALCQSFIILCSSLKPKMFPDWWAADSSGWSTPQVVASITCPHSLLLHLYMLDLAVCEACIVAQNTPLSFLDVMQEHLETASSVNGGDSNVSYTARIKRTLEVCKRLGIESYTGDTFSECTVCQDGGDLVICELCPNVMHLECCRLTETPETFICLECMADAVALSK